MDGNPPFSGPRERTRHFLEKMSVVIDSLFFRGIEALALLLNSLPFPVLRGFSSPGLSTNGLGSLVVENQVRERNTLIRLCFPPLFLSS